MQDLFKIYRMMLAESAILHKKEGNLQLEAMFKNAQGKLRDILNLRSNQEPVVAFVGLTNVGKSTLLSALFGAKVAPARNRPWSSVPVEYRYSDKYEIIRFRSLSISSQIAILSDEIKLSKFNTHFFNK